VEEPGRAGCDAGHRGLVLSADDVPGAALLRTPEVQAQLVREVRERWSGQLPLEGVREPVDVERIVAALCDEVASATIDIPRVLVVPIGSVQSGFSPFTLNLSSVRYPPVSADLWVQHLRTQEHQVPTLGDCWRQGAPPRGLRRPRIGGLR
jgi:type III restriction enzyme